MNEIKVGVDTGGTFTDFVIYAGGEWKVKKIPSTPRDPSLSILEGIREIGPPGIPLWLIHGTTVATNALLERKGGKIALVTTEGFEDVLFIGRQNRRDLYRLQGEGRRPLLPRSRCFGLQERILASGKVERAVTRREWLRIWDKIRSQGVEAVAVCLLHSYANPENERLVRGQLAKTGILFCISSDLLPEHREYERTAATAVNTYLMPVISRYIQNLERRLGRTKLRIMQSNEGHISPAAARAEPIRTALSGPAGGVVGAFNLGKALGLEKIISFDMGGTSTDVSLIEGRISRTSELTIGDFPVRLPLIDIHTVGAGGGSIAYADSGGSLRVGPQSAGAEPGPACYGKGNLPTVTDAHCVLGRLDPDFFLGGQMRIFPGKSRDVVEALARRIGKPLLETAFGIIRIANASMEKAIRVISIERGHDPRESSLVSFGGAGGMHAVEIAESLRIGRVVVPKNAGVLSAFGLLMADSVKDYSRSLLKTVEELEEGEIARILAELKERGLEGMKEEGFRRKDIQVFPSLDLRYLGQSYEISVPWRGGKTGLASVVSDFHRAHQRLYSYSQPKRPVEVVNVRLKAVGSTPKIGLEKQPSRGGNAEGALRKTQPLYHGKRWTSASVYDRSLLRPGNRIAGPALVVDYESTTFLPPGFTLVVDGFLNLVVELRENAHAGL